MRDYPLNPRDRYKFNTRDIVQVTQNVPPKLAQLAGKRGVILYHANYEFGIPTAEAVLIGAKVSETIKYQKTGQIDETHGGQIRTVPIQCLIKLTAIGAELETDSVLA